MKIVAISEQAAAALDPENSFVVEDVFDVALSGREFSLTAVKVEAYLKEYLADDESEGDVAYYGAYIDDALAGRIVLASTWNALASIESIVVARTCRGRGIARGLIEFAKHWALERQLRGIRLETQTNNVPACTLYAGCGFALGGIDLFAYRTQPRVSDEIAMYWYWFPQAMTPDSRR